MATKTEPASANEKFLVTKYIKYVSIAILRDFVFGEVAKSYLSSVVTGSLHERITNINNFIIKS